MVIGVFISVSSVGSGGSSGGGGSSFSFSSVSSFSSSNISVGCVSSFGGGGVFVLEFFFVL